MTHFYRRDRGGKAGVGRGRTIVPPPRDPIKGSLGARRLAHKDPFVQALHTPT